MSFSRLTSRLFTTSSKMASATTLKRITPTKLSQQLLSEANAQDPTIAVIDVRDDDYLGGHIKGSTNIPSRQLDAMMPTLIRRLKEKKTVVFHCMLSQQRGPSAALKYLRESGVVEGQEVYVLDKGFTGWQEQFAEDARLTEGYRAELWIED